ncbi:1,4-dihydroxy-2-naphthoate polyprenyltransferase, partial [Vibrio sp. 665]|uniref:1,4-dihydroxy-2-naphthoate polyprenyltransferase n=1 Tax=Vibrio sp. 665 TaxID=3074609 RepID=UPI002963DA85
MKQSLQIWLEAARPKTLPLALVSILTGSVLAYSAGHFSLTIAIMAFATATLLQILSNLANDYGDAVKGTDNENRLGPQRAMQTGAVSAKQMKQAIIFNIVLTAISGLVLVFYALSSPESIITFIGLGILAIIAAIAYTMGSKPYGYVGLGDISVFLFFGLLGVSGTYFLHTGHVDTTLFLPALGCGLLAVAVLNINNMRDIENDSECGKRTVAVRLGQHKAKQYHFILLGGAILAFAAYLLIQDKPLWISLPFLLSVYVVIHHGKAVWDTEKPAQIAPMLPVIVKCSLVTNVLVATLVV